MNTRRSESGRPLECLRRKGRKVRHRVGQGLKHEPDRNRESPIPNGRRRVAEGTVGEPHAPFVDVRQAQPVAHVEPHGSGADLCARAAPHGEADLRATERVAGIGALIFPSTFIPLLTTTPVCPGARPGASKRPTLKKRTAYAHLRAEFAIAVVWVGRRAHCAPLDTGRALRWTSGRSGWSRVAVTAAAAPAVRNGSADRGRGAFSGCGARERRVIYRCNAITDAGINDHRLPACD